MSAQFLSRGCLVRNLSSVGTVSMTQSSCSIMCHPSQEPVPALTHYTDSPAPFRRCNLAGRHALKIRARQQQLSGKRHRSLRFTCTPEVLPSLNTLCTNVGLILNRREIRVRWLRWNDPAALPVAEILHLLVSPRSVAASQMRSKSGLCMPCHSA